MILRVKSNFSNNVKVANKLVKAIVRTYSIMLQNVTLWLGIDYTNILNLPHKSSHFFTRYSELISLQSGIIHFFSAEISCALPLTSLFLAKCHFKEALELSIVVRPSTLTTKLNVNYQVRYVPKEKVNYFSYHISPRPINNFTRQITRCKKTSYLGDYFCQYVILKSIFASSDSILCK